MARLATWAMTATVLLTAMAGCIGQPPADRDDPLYDPPVCDFCCEGCRQPYCDVGCERFGNATTMDPVERYECGMWDPNATADRARLCETPMPWPPPMFAPFDARLLWPDCDGCASPAVATRSDGALVVATERGLAIADATRVERIEAPMLASAPPSVAVDREGRAWYAALQQDGAAPSVFLRAWLGSDDAWLSTDALDLVEAPMLLATSRVDVAALPDGLVLVLATDEGAWAVRYDGAFREPERLTPLGGTALVGAPVSDARGRVMVPFAFEMHDITAAASALYPRYATAALHYAALGSIDAEWAMHGGMVFPQGITRAPSLELARGAPSAFVWVDAADVVQRVETWDSGGSWGSPAPWSEERATSRAAAARSEHRATVAWWEEAYDESHRLVVARSEGGSMPYERATVALAPGDARAALASWSDGRAALAWSDEKGVWAAVEGTWPDTRCGPDAHCARSLWRH